MYNEIDMGNGNSYTKGLENLQSGYISEMLDLVNNNRELNETQRNRLRHLAHCNKEIDKTLGKGDNIQGA